VQIDLLRHGACEGGHIFRGDTDVPLTGAGWQQMREGLARLAGPWAHIVSSPLQRCRAFAEQQAEKLNLPLSIEPGIREFGFGLWEGQSIEKIWREHKNHCLAWSRAPDKVGPPGGEPYGDFRQRVLEAVEKIARARAGDRTLLVTHGGVIRLLLSVARKKPPSDIMQLTVGYGFAASLNFDSRNLNILYPQESAYVYQG